MAYRYGDRSQSALFPPCVEDYVPQDAAVRAYDAMVDALDFKELGIAIDPDNVGNPQYDPRAMLKLLVYGTSYGIRSSRKLEREVHYNVSFMWLVGALKPDHKTIAEFRRKNKKALSKVLEQCARMCMKLNLVEGNTLFVDGSKIRANASLKNRWTKERCEEALKKADLRIKEILEECEKTDLIEKDHPSLVKLDKDLANHEALKAKVRDILKELKDEDKKEHNTVDPDCTTMRNRQGTYPGYNAQIVVDGKHGLIVSTDTVNDSNDLKQFAKQIDRANQTLEAPCKTACADSGYAIPEELTKIDQKEIKVVVPSQRQASGIKPGRFDKDNFTFDKDNSRFICPEGHTLVLHHSDRTSRSNEYRMGDPHNCLKCRHYGSCTKNKRGRVVRRLWNEDLRLHFEDEYSKPESQSIYKLRQQKVEHPFGHIKRNLKFDSCLMRGIDGANAETSIIATCFNMARMITILGVTGLIKKLRQ